MSVKTNIFELTSDYMNLLREIEESDGEITEDIQDRLAVNKDDFADKLESYRVIINHFEGANNLAELTIKNLQNSINKRNKAIAIMKENLKTVLALIGTPTKSKTTGNISYAYDFKDKAFRVTSSCKEVLQIEDENEVEDKYKKYDLSIKGLTPKVKDKLEEALLKSKNLENSVISSDVKLDKKALLKEAKNKEVKGVSVNKNYNIIIK